MHRRPLISLLCSSLTTSIPPFPPSSYNEGKGDDKSKNKGFFYFQTPSTRPNFTVHRPPPNPQKQKPCVAVSSSTTSRTKRRKKMPSSFLLSLFYISNYLPFPFLFLFCIIPFPVRFADNLHFATTPLSLPWADRNGDIGEEKKDIYDIVMFPSILVSLHARKSPHDRPHRAFPR